MNENLINTAILAGAFLGLFALAEFFYHKLKWKAELTRKIVHIGTGLLTMLFPFFIENHWLVLFLCASFLLILLASFPLKMLPSINNVDRVTRGSILYPFVVYVCYLFYQQFDDLAYYYLPILTLALCDPIAALVGKNFPWKPYILFGHQKTISGSLGFAFSAFLLSAGLLLNTKTNDLFIIFLSALIISIISTVAEAVSHKGYDNLTIPAAVIFSIELIEFLTI